MPVRPPLDPPPNTDAGEPGYVDIRHPAYPDSKPALLHFAAIDGDDGDGVDFEVALVACRIITGNTWHSGYIAEMDTGGKYIKSGSEIQPTEDPTNLITLRRNLHYLFDTRRFIFIPKQDTASQGGSLALHIFSPDDNPDLIPLYHNRSPAPLSGISIEHIFARFAWTIFSDKTLRFFKGVAEYAVLLFDPQVGKIIKTKLRSPEVRVSLKIFSSSSRTPSPKKRPQDQSVEDNQCWAEEEEDDVSVASDWEPPHRQRRKHSWDYFNSNSPPELVQSFISTESDRSESQDGIAERSEVEVRPYSSPDTAAIRHYTAPGKITRDNIVERPQKRVDIGPTRDKG